MTYVLPRGLRVVARKGPDVVRVFSLREQLMFEAEDLVSQNPKDYVFQNGDWTLTAKKTEVETI